MATVAGLVAAVRPQWPQGRVIVRADSWFATPELNFWCEQHHVGYLRGLPGNAVLHRKCQPWLAQAKRRAAGSPTKCARCFGTFPYQAQGWPKARRVIVKTGVTWLWADETVRGRGFGRQLMERAEALARSRG